MQWVRSAFLLVGGSLTVAAALGLFGVWEPPIFLALGMATAFAMIAAVRIHRPSHVWPWLGLAVAIVFFLAGGGARGNLGTMGDLTAERSLFPDLLSLPGYVLLAAGLLGFSRSGGRGSYQASIILDGLIAALALAALAWVFAVQPMFLRYPEAPPLVKLVLTMYPPMSIFLVVVTLRIAFNPDQERVPAFWFLVAAHDVHVPGRRRLHVCGPQSHP